MVVWLSQYLVIMSISSSLPCAIVMSRARRAHTACNIYRYICLHDCEYSCGTKNCVFEMKSDSTHRPYSLKDVQMRHVLSVQGGEDSKDPLSCRSISTKEPLIIGHFCRKWPIKIRDPMSLRHPVYWVRLTHTHTLHLTLLLPHTHTLLQYKVLSHSHTHSHWVQLNELRVAHNLGIIPTVLPAYQNSAHGTYD